MSERGSIAMADQELPSSAPLRHMLWLAWVLSAVYLAFGGAVALLNRATQGRLYRLSEALDQFSGAFLQLVNLWRPLMHALAEGRLEGWQIRVILMALSVALIFGYALALGLLLTGARSLWLRLGPR